MDSESPVPASLVKLFLLVPGLLVLTAAAAALKPPGWKTGSLDAPWPLQKMPTILPAPEQTLYRRLEEELPHHRVLTQVQLLQTVRFKRGSRDAGIRNRISQLSMDFPVFTPQTAIVAAIELNDATHTDEQRAADARKAHALKSAGTPLLVWYVREMPDIPAIRTAVAAVPGRH